MVKIPSFDDLKKMGSELVDSAKSGKIGGMVEKLKSGIESVGAKKTPMAMALGDETIQAAFIQLYVTLKELGDTRATETALMKKLEDQLSELAKTIEASRKSSTSSPDLSETNEDKKL